VQVSGMSNVIAVAAGNAHTVALRNDGTIWTWGNNSNGQLGNGTITQSLVPLPLENMANIIAIAAGSTHTAALRNDIITVSLWMWGNNSNGQLGIGNMDQSLVPVQTPGLSGTTPGVLGITAIAAGSAHTTALINDGTVWTWGNNSNGQLGIGNTQQSLVAVQVSGMTNAMAVAAGSLHSLVMKNDDSVWGWGSNGNGQLGDGTTTDRLTPVGAQLP
jgi:alpha-tubulin suppressor-like RCC1 family protein